MLSGLALVTSAFTVLTTTSTTSGYGHLVLFQILAGLGAGVVFCPATAAVMGAVPQHSAGLGSAINDATRQIGAAAALPQLPASQQTRLANVVAEAFIIGMTRTATITGAVILVTAVAVSCRYPTQTAQAQPHPASS
ncbi:hypothetical protein [Streptomyces sp. RPT161]|uniref:hypothetical protein n=1 Tax=Streptomyces sp. RPT161 TaxID=3015993 RepID=UPI0022B89AED|nr:hypothetical protein [Streptomyces sp. RPT161]